MAYDIPIQQFVEAVIRLGTLLAQVRNFGLPLFVTPENTPGIDQGERVRSYDSITAVAEDWDVTDEVYKMAETAFAANPGPETILIGVRFTENQPGVLYCGALASGVNIDTFKAVTDGAFVITVDGGSPAAISGLDFSSDTSLAEAATRISTAIFTSGATCAYDDERNRFVFTSVLLGDNSKIDFLAAPASGTNISGSNFLNGAAGSTARKVDGLTVGEVKDEFNNILGVNDTAYFLAATKELRDTEDIKDVAVWVDSLPQAHQLFITSNQPEFLDPAVDTDTIRVLNLLGVKRTWGQYSGHVDEYPEVSALAYPSTVNFAGIDTMITMFFSSPSSGITAEDASGVGAPIFGQAQLSTANNKGGNVYGRTGGSTALVTQGQMTGGYYQDILHFADWLKNAIETNVFNVLRQASADHTRIPYTEPGLAQLQNAIAEVFEQGIRNGGLAPTIDEAGQFLEAYTIDRVPVRDVSPADKAARKYEGFSWDAYTSGAVHSVKKITGKLIQ